MQLSELMYFVHETPPLTSTYLLSAKTVFTILRHSELLFRLVKHSLGN